MEQTFPNAISGHAGLVTGIGMEGSSKKEKRFMDMDNSVVTERVRSRGWKWKRV